MNDRQIDCFLTIVNEGSLAKAATLLFVSSSSLSQIIKKMEDEVGAPLFSRQHRQIQLTYAGQRFYELAQVYKAQRRQLQTDIAEHDNSDVGDLVISLSVKRASSLLPTILPSYIKQFPKVKVNAIVDLLPTHERIQKLHEGKYTFAITTYPQNLYNGAINLFRIGTEYMTLFFAKSSPLASRLVQNSIVPESVTLEEIAEEPLILSNNLYGGRIMVEQMFSHIGRVPNIAATVSSIDVAKSIVERGLFCTLSPEIYPHGKMNVDPYRNYYAIRISNQNFHDMLGIRPIYIAHERSLQMATYHKAFISTVMQFLGDEPSSQGSFCPGVFE